ncbi:tetratricopeptide repeat protein [Aliinostoc sp. HNIBRCY26]|uniref:tetratricopeptide repeat protein n=1 Tax=Aliinostoc sp. HNIBRCY26 TaxID=3418997 RepID=UPI003CFCA239
MNSLKLAATIIVCTTLAFTPKAEAKNLFNHQQIPTSQVTAQSTESEVYANLQRGIDLLEGKNYQAAIEKFTQVLEVDPNNIYAYVGRGAAKIYIEQYQAANTDFDAALAINPNIALAYYFRGISNYYLRDKTAAIADFRQASALFKKEGKLDLAQKADSAIKEIEAS